MDSLFLRQVWAGNDAMLQDLARRGDELGRARLHYFLHQQGPVVPARPQSRVHPRRAAQARGRELLPRRRDQGRRAEVDRRARRRPEGAGDRVLHDDPPRRRTARCSPSPTTWSTRASSRTPPPLLREAADLTDQPTLKKFLTARADAFLSNDYYASDVAWMELDASIEPTIGPYEVYEDEWFNYKAAFEAFITVRDEAESKKLAGASRRTCRISRTRCRSTRRSATRSSARWRPSASSTSSSAPATATAACRPPPTTCPTTSASSRRRAPSA